MMISVSIVGAAAQDDLLRNSVFRLADEDREITGAYVETQGSSTLTNKGRVSLFIGTELAANLDGQQNAAQGLQLFPIDAIIPGGAELRAIVDIAPAGGTTTTTVTIQIDELDDEMDDDF